MEPRARPMHVFEALGLWLLAAVGMVYWATVAGALRFAVSGASLEHAFHAALTDMITLGFVQILAFAPPILLATRRTVQSGWGDALALRPVSPAVLGLLLLAGAALQLPIAELGNLLQLVLPADPREVEQMAALLSPRTPLEGFGLVFAVVIVAPVTEELLFRGLMLPRLGARHGPRLALATSALLFGLMHLHVSNLGVVVAAVASLAGLLLGAVALRFRSTYASIAVHVGVNAVPVMLAPLAVQVPGLDAPPGVIEHVPWWLLLPSVAVAVLAVRLADRIASDGEEEAP